MNKKASIKGYLGKMADDWFGDPIVADVVAPSPYENITVEPAHTDTTSFGSVQYPAYTTVLGKITPSGQPTSRSDVTNTTIPGIQYTARLPYMMSDRDKLTNILHAAQIVAGNRGGGFVRDGKQLKVNWDPMFQTHRITGFDPANNSISISKSMEIPHELGHAQTGPGGALLTPESRQATRAFQDTGYVARNPNEFVNLYGATTNIPGHWVSFNTQLRNTARNVLKDERNASHFGMEVARVTGDRVLQKEMRKSYPRALASRFPAIIAEQRRVAPVIKSLDANKPNLRQKQDAWRRAQGYPISTNAPVVGMNKKASIKAAVLQATNAYGNVVTYPQNAGPALTPITNWFESVGKMPVNPVSLDLGGNDRAPFTFATNAKQDRPHISMPIAPLSPSWRAVLGHELGHSQEQDPSQINRMLEYSKMPQLEREKWEAAQELLKGKDQGIDWGTESQRAIDTYDAQAAFSKATQPPRAGTDELWRLLQDQVDKSNVVSRAVNPSSKLLMVDPYYGFMRGQETLDTLRPYATGGGAALGALAGGYVGSKLSNKRALKVLLGTIGTIVGAGAGTRMTDELYGLRSARMLGKQGGLMDILGASRTVRKKRDDKDILKKLLFAARVVGGQFSGPVAAGML